MASSQIAYVRSPLRLNRRQTLLNNLLIVGLQSQDAEHPQRKKGTV
jgi:hypothetical protein